MPIAVIEWSVINSRVALMMMVYNYDAAGKGGNDMVTVVLIMMVFMSDG